MGALNLLPHRFRVLANAVRQDLRNVRKAVVEDRRGTCRVRSRRRPLPTGEDTTQVRSPAAATSEPTSNGETNRVAYFALSGIEVEVGPDETILQAGLSAGVDLIFSCTLGGCGACMLTCTEGEVEYDDPDAICLIEQDIEEGLCLACVGRPSGRVVLDA